MIVRDVVLSSETRALRPVARGGASAQASPAHAVSPTSAAGSPPPSAARASVPASASASSASAPNQAGPAGLSTMPSAPSAPTPILTPDAVACWLATQPADIRAVVASSLATEINTLREQGRAQGLELGRTQGLQEVSRRAESSLAALGRAAAAAEEAFGLEAAALANSCADIVSEAFLKIAGQHLASREAVLGAVAEVIKRIKDSREVTIRVSGQDLALLCEQEQAIQHALGGRHSTLVADPRVNVGGCLVESELGTLDGRLEVQLRELFETIRTAKAAQWADA